METGELQNRRQKMKVLVLFYHRDLVFIFIFNCHNVTCVIEKNEFPTMHDDHQKCLERDIQAG